MRLLQQTKSFLSCYATPMVAIMLGVAVGCLLAQKSDKDMQASEVHTTQAPKRTKPSLTPPTMDTANAMAKMSAAECEEKFYELVQAGPNVSLVKLQILFHHWMTVEKPAVIWQKLSENHEAKRFGALGWHDALLIAWAALDYQEARKATAKNHYIRESRAMIALLKHDTSVVNDEVDFFSITLGSKLHQAFEDFCLADPESARIMIVKKQNVDGSILRCLLRALAANDPRDAFLWYQARKKNRLETHDENLGEILSAWRRQDPDGMMNWLKEHASDIADFEMNRRSSARHQTEFVSNRRASVSLGELHAILSQAKDLKQKFDFFVGATYEHSWLAPDPAKAAVEVLDLPPGLARDYLAEMMCMQWAAINRDEARSFAEKHGIKFSLSSAARDIRIRSVYDKPVESFQMLVESNQLDKKVLDTAFDDAEFWGQARPEALTDWLLENPSAVQKITKREGNLDMLLSNAIGYQVAQYDLQAALAVIDAQPDALRKRVTWQACEHYIREYNPELAFRLSMEWYPEEQQVTFLRNNLESVREKIGLYPALHLLDSAEISESNKQALRQELTTKESQ